MFSLGTVDLTQQYFHWTVEDVYEGGERIGEFLERRGKKVGRQLVCRPMPGGWMSRDVAFREPIRYTDGRDTSGVTSPPATAQPPPEPKLQTKSSRPKERTTSKRKKYGRPHKPLQNPVLIKCTPEDT